MPRGGSRTVAIFKMELFLAIVNGFQLLSVLKRSILDVAAVLDPPPMSICLPIVNIGKTII